MPSNSDADAFAKDCLISLAICNTEPNLLLKLEYNKLNFSSKKSERGTKRDCKRLLILVIRLLTASKILLSGPTNAEKRLSNPCVIT